MIIHASSGDNIYSGNNKDSQILDLRKIVKVKNEEIKKIILLNNLKKIEKDNLNKLILPVENIPKINFKKIEENVNNQYDFRLKKLDTENYRNPDFRRKINLFDFNQKLSPLKEFQNINLFKSIKITPHRHRNIKLDKIYRIKNSYEKERDSPKKIELKNQSPIKNIYDSPNSINSYSIKNSRNKILLNKSPSNKNNRSLNISFSKEEINLKIMEMNEKEREERKLERKRLDKIIKRKEKIQLQKSLKEIKIKEELKEQKELE